MTRMDWQVTRHTSVLWGFIQELQQDPKCSLFFDLTIYCSDGELPWNRLCLALSIPSCAAILNYDVPETEVAVSLADITMAELQTQLENCLPIKATIHPSLVPGGGKVSYNLVPAKPSMQNGDVGSDSDACAGDQLDPSDEENNSGILPKKRKEKLKKKCSKLKKKTKRRIQSESESGDDFNAGDLLDPSDEGESEVSKDGSEVENLEKNKSQKSKSNYSKYEKPAEFDSDEWEDFCGGGGGVSAGELSIGESDEEESSLDEDSESQTKSKRRRKASESESESEEDSPKRKRGPKRKRRVKKMAESSDEETESDEEEQPMVAINANDIKLEPGVEPKTKKKRPRGPKSRRKKKVKKKRRVKFDDDEDGDYDMAMSLAISGSEDSSEKEYDFGKIARSEKLTMDCRADVAKYELTENQLDDKMVIVRKTRKALRRPGRPVKKEKELPEPMEVKMEVVEEERIPVDITAGGVEEELVAPLITKYQVGETVIKQCNTCPWSTDRKDKITIREHLFKHYPDVCGFACPVCRKPVKRKRELILHMERTHTPECLKLFGVEYMKQYEVGFDTNSEEQVNLRAEEYIASDCGNCKETFFSAERVKFHVEIGLCVFREEKLKVPKPQILYRGEFFDEERKKLDRVDMLDSSSSSEDERKSKKKRRNNSSEDEDFHPGEFFDYQPGILSVEQLPIHANMEGLISSLKGSPPYACVVPSCKKKTYPNRTAIKRHYVSHDPEMYSTLTCPVCKDFNKPEDQPGPMIKHIMKHGKSDGWARENVIVDVSERLQQFRDATGVFGGRRGGFGISRGRRANFGRERRKGINSKCKKCSISIDDPKIKASFEKGGEHSDQGPQWKCGVPDCTEVFRLAYELKRHYWKHDKTLFNKLLECDLCSYSTHLHRLMQNHLEEEHPDQLFLAGEGDFNYTAVEGKRWQEFNTAANTLIEANPNHHMGKEWQSQHEKEIFQTISATCNLCAEVFNTQNSFEDHEKVHKPELIKFTCEMCDEGFIVESVYKNHIKSHSVLYTSLRSGPIRCNGCSQHFQRVMEVKKHMSTHHMNLLENCHFCEQCTDWFTFKHSLRNHMFTHADKVYRCPVCPQKQFLTQEEADEHVARKRCRAKENNHICTDCGRRFGSPKLLDIHINKVHHSVLQYQCNICHQLFENTHLMEKHIRKSHKLETGSVLEYYTFHSLEAAKLLDVEKLNMHKPKGRRGVRTDEKYPCPFGCGGTFKRSGLTRHKKVCNRSSDEYKVEVSNAEDVDRKVNEIMEPSTDPVTGKMLWKCTQCNYTNKLRFTVKEHCEIHIPGLAHQCPHCPKTCPTRNALRVHVIRHHDQKLERKKKEEDEMDLDMEPLPIEQTGAKKITSEQQQNEISEARAWLDELAGKQLQNNLMEIETRLDNDIATNGNGQDHPMSLSIKPPPKKMTLMPKTQKDEYVIQYNKPKHNSNNVTIIHHHPPQKRENQIEQKHHPSYHQPKPQPSPQLHKQVPVLDQDQMAKLQASYDMQHHMAKPKQQVAKPKPPREPPRHQEQQPVPPNAHMGQINQGILNHLNHPMLMNPMSPMMNRNYFDDNVSQHSEDNNIAFADDRQQQDLNRQPPLPPITRDNSQNAQNPYGLPGYNFPIWPFYRQ